MPAQVTLDFLVNEHKYIADNIKFADQKAGLTFAFVSGLLALIGTDHSYSNLNANFTSGWFMAGLVMFGLVSLVGAGAAAALTLVPRTRAGIRSGIVFFGHVAGHATADDYAYQVLLRKDFELASELAKHCFVLAHIASTKYRLVRIGIVLAALAASALLPAVVVDHSPVERVAALGDQ